MRYDEVRLSGGGGSFWLRWRLLLTLLRGTRRVSPPATRWLQLNDHLLRDIGVAPPHGQMSWHDFG